MTRTKPRPTPLDQARAPWGWAGVGAMIGLLVVLVGWAPARWLASALAAASQGVVQLAEPRGTVWAGSGRLVLTGGAGSQGGLSLLGRIHWTLRPGIPALSADIRADCCTASQPIGLRLTPRWGGAQLAVGDGQSTWPAGALAGLGTPWNTIQAEGELELSTQGLSVEWLAGRIAAQGSAQVTARGLSSRLTTLKPMGSYRMTLTGGATPQLDLSTLDGALRLSGQGRWVGARLRFNGEAQAAPGMEAALANLLNIIGRRSGDRILISVG